MPGRSISARRSEALLANGTRVDLRLLLRCRQRWQSLARRLAKGWMAHKAQELQQARMSGRRANVRHGRCIVTHTHTHMHMHMQCTFFFLFFFFFF